MAKKPNPLIAEVEQAVVAPAKTEQKALAQIWERRLVNPLQSAAADIQLKTPGWELHWVDSGNPGRFYKATREQGWVPVTPEELADDLNDLGLTDNKDGKVRRGPKGTEILMKVPVKVFSRIRQRKAEIVLKTVKKTRENLAQAASNRFGDRAGDFMLGKGSVDKDGTSGLKGELIDKIGETVVE